MTIGVGGPPLSDSSNRFACSGLQAVAPLALNPGERIGAPAVGAKLQWRRLGQAR
jgi:hypothetical protein